ncbi:G-type lectin S-receptor-like serine/threonine-protein kinase At4g27290 [Morus notabilis]|uniref:G-type lectin S-receptor-like serine/threonine-protein kinase At4g27290 n=1 Tax=Morus notabilis TaxID=981085 RepID=UPI000CED41E8|nr:G-type lectin S-receptor-like serine/threonine-protein kinase At4g27290 [Morus notabilis]
MFSSLFYIALLLFLLYGVSLAVDSINPLQSISDGETLVSKEGVFEFGFFSPGNSKGRYVGVWYKKIPVQTVVWVANRCSPLNDSSGLLMINKKGNLVLLYQNKRVVWSTSLAKQAQKPILQLLDSGNLVVQEEQNGNLEGYLWQSFDYPGNTMLPGMKLGWDLRKGFNRQFSAWRNWNDPCPGDFTSGIEIDVQQQTFPDIYMWKGGEKHHRAGPWNGLGTSGMPVSRPNYLYDFDVIYDEEEVYYTFNLKKKSLITIEVLNQTTLTVNRLTWVEAEKNWKIYYSVPTDQCDNYGLCGGNGYCVIGGNPACQCLKGYKPKSEEKWYSTDWSEGCVRNTPLDCKDKYKDGFVKFVGMKLPDTAYSRSNKSMNLKECRAKCSTNCSCMAYANSDIRNGGSGCIMWFGGLMDMRIVTSSEQALYVRMPASELGKSGSKVRAVKVVAIIGPVSGVLLLGFFIWRKKFKEKYRKTAKYGDQEEDLELPLFELSTIIAATRNFSPSNKLGQGGFGPVYKGKLDDGQEIAVKRLSISSGQGIDEFKNEVTLIAKLQHRNLVKLLGCCIQGLEKLLVYEYMPNKSLDVFIFDQTQHILLEWSKRFNIICGIARGLLYLHQDSRLRIIHRDLKNSNILLDNEMNPKISDFGLARTFGGDDGKSEGKTKRVIGTHGYMAPEYVYNGRFSTKSDVFSFGVMVLEIVSGKRSTSFSLQNEGLTLTGHAWTLMQQGRAIELLDSRLRDSHHNLQEVLRCIHVGLLCVQQRAVDRPSMFSVIVMLSSNSSLLPCPKRPGYFIETELPQRYCDPLLSNTITISGPEAR